MKAKVILILSLFSFGFGTPASGQWVKMSPASFGGPAKSIVALGSSIFLPPGSVATNNGESWEALSLDSIFPQSRGVRQFALIGTYIFAGTRNGVFLSTDSGITWRSANSGLPNDSIYHEVDEHAPIRSLTVFGTSLYVITEKGEVYRTTDFGNSWLQVGPPVDDVSHLLTIAVSDAAVLVGISSKGILRLSHDKNSWDTVDSGLPNLDIYSLAVSGKNFIAGMIGGNGIYISSDSGSSWRPSDLGFTGSATYSIFTKNKTIFAGSNKGNFYSTDDGLTWIGIGGPSAYAIAENDTYLFVGDELSNLWRRPLAEILPSSTVETSKVEKHSIIRVSPNPISQSTSIYLASTEHAFGRVTMVNLLGEEVAHLFSGELEPGDHTFQWNASGVAAGAYQCVIETEGKITALPVIVSK
jgi:hypothetical protein